jgi:hypothetical protein
MKSDITDEFTYIIKKMPMSENFSKIIHTVNHDFYEMEGPYVIL